jgi:protein-L-isoaspartate(D-aspartate) O-methyltransferase
MGIVGDEPVMRATLVQHAGNGMVVTQPWDCNAPRLLHFPEPERFRFWHAAHDRQAPQPLSS